MKVLEPVFESFKKTGIKVIFAFGTPLEHTFWLILEANDITATHRALTPLIRLGTSRLIPIEKYDWMMSG